MATTLRIATFNVLFGDVGHEPGSWSSRSALWPRVVARLRPDVLGMQEVFPSMLDDVRRELEGFAVLPGPFTGRARKGDVALVLDALLKSIRTRRIAAPSQDASPLRRAHTTTGHLQPIAYRADRLRPIDGGGFWVSDTPDRPGSKLFFAPTPFLVHWARFERVDEAGSFLFLNAHFGHAPWHHLPTARVVGERMRALETPGDLGTFLVGDFNAWPSSPLVRRLTALPGYFDARRAARERRGPAVTYHWGVGSSRLGLVLDHVIAKTSLVPKSAEIIDVREGGLFPSDHYPLVVEFGDGEPRSAS